MSSIVCPLLFESVPFGTDIIKKKKKHLLRGCWDHYCVHQGSIHEIGAAGTEFAFVKLSTDFFICDSMYYKPKIYQGLTSMSQ